MALVGAVARLLAIPKDRPELLVAQASAFARQMPRLYFVVVINAFALAMTFFDTAPWQLTVGAVGVLGTGAILRTLAWWRARRHPLDAGQA